MQGTGRWNMRSLCLIILYTFAGVNLYGCAKDVQLEPPKPKSENKQIKILVSNKKFNNKASIASPKVTIGGGTTPLAEKYQKQFQNSIQSIFNNTINAVGSEGKLIFVLEKAHLSYEVSAATTLPIIGLFAQGQSETMRGRISGTLEYENKKGKVTTFKNISIRTKFEGQMALPSTRAESIKMINKKTTIQFRKQLLKTIERYFYKRVASS